MHVVSHAAKNRLRLAGRMDTALGVFDSGGRATCFQRMARLLDTNRRPKVRLGLVSICTLLLAAVLTLPQIRAGEDSPRVEKPAVEETTETARAEKAAPAEQPVKAAGGGAEKKAAKASGRSLLLTVLDDKDKPVPGAKVKVWSVEVSGGPSKTTRNRCDENGRLRIDLPDKTPGYYSIHVDSPGYAPFHAAWEQRDGPDPIPDSYTMRLDPGRSIGGIVQDEDGKPIPGVEVNTFFDLKQREELAYVKSVFRVTADAQGRWSYPSFPANLQQVKLSLRHPEYVFRCDKGPISKFAISEDATLTGVSVMKRGLIITGKVTDENGRPVAGAVVHYHHLISGSRGFSKEKTDKNGSYRFTNGRVDDAFLTASAEGWATSRVKTRIEPGMKPVDFKLTRGQPLRVRVIGPDKKPIAGALLSPRHGRGFHVLSSDRMTDADGVWKCNHVPQGPIWFHISKQG